MQAKKGTIETAWNSKRTALLSLMRIAFSMWMLLCLGAALSGVDANGNESEEGPPVLFARSLLSEEVMEGPHHRVAPIVRVERFRYRFTLTSDFGDVEVWGANGVRKGAKEYEAIAVLKEIGQTEAFARSFSRALRSPVVQAWNVARRPVKTVVGLPGGIGRYLQGKFYQVRRGAGKAVAYVNGNGDDDEKKEKKEKTKLGKKARRLSRKHLGFNDAKREWAQRLGVDPYSKNELLQEELGRIAWASSLGSFSADFAIPGSDALSYAGRAQSVVWEKSAHQVERLNHVTLKEMGFEKERILEFQDNDLYSLSEKVELLLALEDIGGTEGEKALLELALGAQDDQDATFMIEMFGLLANCSSRGVALEKIEIRRGLAVGLAKDGRLVLPLALDYLHWSSEIAVPLQSKAYDAEKRELWITGSASPIARYRLRQIGWEVKELEDKPETSESPVLADGASD